MCGDGTCKRCPLGDSEFFLGHVNGHFNVNLLGRGSVRLAALAHLEAVKIVAVVAVETNEVVTDLAFRPAFLVEGSLPVGIIAHISLLHAFLAGTAPSLFDSE